MGGVGDGKQWEPEWMDEDGVIHKGEIVGPRRRRKAGGQPIIDEDLVRAVIDARVKGGTLRDIADAYGISHETVRKWCGEAIKSRRAEIDVVGLRVEAAMHLEAARREAWKLHAAGEAAQMPKVMLDSLTQVGQHTMAHARLMGLLMPTKVDVQVTELSQAELELQEMLREAQAKAAAAEAEVIRAASEDPDL